MYKSQQSSTTARFGLFVVLLVLLLSSLSYWFFLHPAPVEAAIVEIQTESTTSENPAPAEPEPTAPEPAPIIEEPAALPAANLPAMDLSTLTEDNTNTGAENAEQQSEPKPPPRLTLSSIEDVQKFLRQSTLEGIGPQGAVVNGEFYTWGSFVEPSETITLVQKTAKGVQFSAFNRTLLKPF